MKEKEKEKEKIRKDASSVESTGSYCGGLRLSSQHPHGGMVGNLLELLFLGIHPVASSVVHRYYMHVVPRDTCRQSVYKCPRKSILKNEISCKILLFLSLLIKHMGCTLQMPAKVATSFRWAHPDIPRCLPSLSYH